MDDIKIKIDNESKEIYHQKLLFENEVHKQMNLTNKKYILIDNEKDIIKEFAGLWTYIQEFYEYLWNDPYLIYKIISNSNIDDIKNNLGNFFMNNFYDNILSENEIEDNLMYIIYLLLKEEIDNISDINNNEKFLENTPCGIFLEQLCDKMDIKSFIKMNILNVVENLTWTFSSKRLSFNIKSIQKNITKIKEEFKIKAKPNNNKNNAFMRSKTNAIIEDKEDIGIKSCLTGLSSISDLSNMKEFLNQQKNEKNNDIFINKYMPDVSLTIKNIKKNNYENDKKSDTINGYIKHQIEISKSMKNKKPFEIYANEFFVGNLYGCSMPDEVLPVYASSFLKTIEIINLLFKNLLSNLHLMPNSIKSICKIISILIIKKFPNINKTQHNSFIAKFFFNKLLFPIFINPLHKALINECIITGETINNIKIIISIIDALCSGKFFTQYKGNGNYTTFNNFFLEIMPDFFEFIENISEGSIPSFIGNLINDNENFTKDFKPDYFKEHPDEIIYYRTIFFCFDDLYALIQNINKCKDKLFINENRKIIEIIFNKINKNNNMTIFEKIMNNIEYEVLNNETVKNTKKSKKDEQKIELKKYFLFNKILINEKYSYILKLNIENKPYLNIKELENNETNEEIDKNYIIKVKNMICAILYDYIPLKNINLKENEKMDSFKIFKEFKKYIKLPNFIINENFPIEWYINTLLEYLKKIPKNLSENDFELLYKELEQDINNSIKSLNFDILSSLLDRFKLSKKIKIFNIQANKKLSDIYLNDKVNYIIEYTKISVELYYNYNEKEKKISIKEMKSGDTSLSFLDALICKYPPIGTEICKTIKSFTNKFPNIVKNPIFQNENQKLFEMLKQIKAPKELIKYLNIIKKKLYNLKLWSNEIEFNNILNKIYDYVTEKIYDKIYPKIPCNNDIIIYNNCLKLAWTEPKHYIKNKKNFIFDSFLPDIIYNFNQIDKVKSPRKKMAYIKDIFNSINKVEEFNGDDCNNIGIDDQIPILTYAFIKAHPNNIETNCNFIELFIEKDGEDDNLLIQIRLICKFILDINYSALNGVSKEEFDSKMMVEDEK